MPTASTANVLSRPVLSPGMLSSAVTLAAGSSLLGAVPDPALVPSIFRPESVPADSIHQLSLFVLAVTAGIFLVVFGLIAYATWRFRQRPGDDGREPAQIYGSNPVEAAWTIVPLIIVVVLSLATARVLHEVQNAPMPPSALEVEVVGHQWWWEIRYPKLGIVTANELHVPVSSPADRRPTYLDLRSADVIHSFWVPRLAGKTDLVPGRRNRLWIEPRRAGLFLGQCAEYCGTQHAKMLLRVIVHTPEDFERWVQSQRAAPGPVPDTVAPGRRVFEQTACVNCHALDGTIADGRFGPDLTHLMSRDTLGAGAAANSRDNLREWIRRPDRFKPGVLMPAMNLSDTQLDQLVDYLVTLR